MACSPPSRFGQCWLVCPSYYRHERNRLSTGPDRNCYGSFDAVTCQVAGLRGAGPRQNFWPLDHCQGTDQSRTVSCGILLESESGGADSSPVSMSQDAARFCIDATFRVECRYVRSALLCRHTLQRDSAASTRGAGQGFWRSVDLTQASSLKAGACARNQNSSAISTHTMVP